MHIPAYACTYLNVLLLLQKLAPVEKGQLQEKGRKRLPLGVKLDPRSEISP
jgi:hypothetical protein